MDDLSAITAGIMGGSSMGASNTISVQPPFGAKGSESEATDLLTQVHSTPDLELGTTEDYARFEHSGADEAHAGYGWSYVQGATHG